MKKNNLFLIPVILIMMFTILTSQITAGDIPETMLTQKDASTFFGKVLNIDGDKITVEQTKNIKGEFEEGKEETYDRWHYSSAGNPEKLEPGKTYLIGKVNNNSEVYIWAFKNEDLDKIKILSTDDMSKRLNQYLNEGKFTEENSDSEENTKTEKDKNENTKNNTTVKYIPLSVAILFAFIATFTASRKKQK